MRPAGMPVKAWNEQSPPRCAGNGLASSVPTRLHFLPQDGAARLCVGLHALVAGGNLMRYG